MYLNSCLMAKEQHQVELLASCTTEGNLTASISLKGGAVCDKLGDGCEIEFPVQMDIHIKYGLKCYFKDSKSSFSMKPRSFFLRK